MLFVRIKSAALITALLVIVEFSPAIAAQGQIVSETQQAADEGKVWIDEQTGVKLPLEATFVDETGAVASLGSLITRPTILLPIYFYCPNSCSTNLANLALAVNRMKLEAGKDYQVIALSFNDKETPEEREHSSGPRYHRLRIQTAR
ncbi:MAG: hypothetical protein P8X39_11095 [Desulfofustis sp.]